MSTNTTKGLGLLALLTSAPLLLIVLIAGLVVIAVLIGVSIIVYITLVSYHLMTAVVFGVTTLLMFVASAKAGVINDKFIREHPWIFLLLPLSFGLGYAVENAKLLQYSVAPYSVASPLQVAPTSVALLLLVAAEILLVASALD